MSGGFFRGTSADQDTRFSNKQAKLMKSQKFAPELDHLVDISKVKMDVIKPWIANRVTELLGFEDEVLINFIYSLLDGKEVNGKEIQISLTGFMEKNTGKFMKELWTLLLSAQRNASSVPQQFLDAKEEEIRKKKEEADRIANEIQKKREKENREFELDRLKKMDGGAEEVANSSLDANLKNVMPRASSDHYATEKGNDTLNGKGGRRRRTPSRSLSRSFSNSRSNSGDGNKGRSLSRSPEEPSRKVHHSPHRRSITPHQRDPQESLSPRRRSPYARRRSRSPFRRRSPSPFRRRLHSPFYRRSRSPVRRRSPSLVRRHRSPTPVRRGRTPSPARRGRTPSPARRGRTPSPARRGRTPSPARRGRTPSPARRGRSPSPAKRGRLPSPARRGRSPSPARRGRSPSPVKRRRSPSPLRRRRSPSPLRRRRSPSPIRRRMSLSPTRRRSPRARRPRSPSSEEYRSLSPMQRQSRSPVQRRYHRSPSTPPRKSPSPVRRKATIPLRRRSILSPPRSSSPIGSPSSAGHGISLREQRTSSKHQRSPVQSPNQLRSGRMSSPAANRQSSPVRPSKKEQKDRSQSQRRNQATSFVVEKSSDLSGSSPGDRRKAGEGKRSSSHSESPVDLARERMIQIDELSKKPSGVKTHQGSLEWNKEMEEHKHAKLEKLKTYTKPFAVGNLKYSNANVDHKENSPETFIGHQSTDTRFDVKELRKNDLGLRSERKAPDDLKVPAQYKNSLLVDGQQGYSKSNEGKNSNEKNQSHSNKVKDGGGNGSNFAAMSAEKAIHEEQSGVFTSDSEHKEKSRNRDVEKRKHKRRHEVASASDYSSDSGLEERKEAKRRKKEERRLRKEKKRLRREKRRHRKEERGADKLKAKNHGGEYSSDDKHTTRKKSRAIDDEEESELLQKKLEKELREKALESFKAKRGINR